MARLVLLFLVSTTHAMLIGDANIWLRSSCRELCLLPFPMADGLLPGESLQIHICEASKLNLLDVSMQRHHGCVAQLLERPSASSSEVASYCSVSPLLEVREHRLCDDGGIWCSLTCVSAVTLEGVELRTVDEQQDLDGFNLATRHAPDDNAPFLVACACLLQEADAPSERNAAANDDEARGDEALFAREVSTLHEEVNALRRTALDLNPDGPITNSDRITSGGERIGPPPAADDRVTDGAYRLGPLIGPYISATELTELRLDAASVRGGDEPPAPLDESNRLNELWGTTNSDSLHRRMLSFVAVESLHESYRMAAAAINDTPSRMRHALKGLRARRASLAAEVALRRAGSCTDGRSDVSDA